MKKVIIYAALLAGLTFTGCNDSFLEKYPVTDLTEENAFKSYDNFKSFMWPCYEMFVNTTIRTSTASNGWGTSGQYGGDVDANYLNKRSPSGFNQFAYQTKGSTASGNGWDFSSYIRRINIMLSHVEESDMTQAEKDHWTSVGYFFHSFWYMELIDRFGDIPWVDKVLTESSPEVYEDAVPVRKSQTWFCSACNGLKSILVILRARMVRIPSIKIVCWPPYPVSHFAKVRGVSIMNWAMPTPI